MLDCELLACAQTLVCLSKCSSEWAVECTMQNIADCQVHSQLLAASQELSAHLVFDCLHKPFIYKACLMNVDKNL